MKKIMLTLIAMLTIAVSAKAMTYEQARNEALFLTDKMAYELNLSDAQYEAAYEINLDYLMSVTSQYDVFGPYWERRNLDLSYILFSWQWEAFCAATYFYRPLFWESGYWHFGIYARYPHRDYFYFGRPHFYATYRGGHSWHMNGGHSYYEGRRDYYRPGNPSRDGHFGMRNGWDRGDYRADRRQSSTHVTEGGRGGYQPRNGNDRRGGNDNRNGYRNDNDGYRNDGYRNENNRNENNGGFGSTRRGSQEHHDSRSTTTQGNSGYRQQGGGGQSSGSFGQRGGSSSNSRNNGSSGSYSNGGRNSSGSYSNGGRNSSGSYSNGGRGSSGNFGQRGGDGGATRSSGGSTSGSRSSNSGRNGGSSGSFGGSRR